MVYQNDILSTEVASCGITRCCVRMTWCAQNSVNKKCCIWMQVGIENEEAVELANQAGLDVVMNACPKLEYPKFNIKEEEATNNSSSKL